MRVTENGLLTERIHAHAHRTWFQLARQHLLLGSKRPTVYFSGEIMIYICVHKCRLLVRRRPVIGPFKMYLSTKPKLLWWRGCNILEITPIFADRWGNLEDRHVHWENSPYLRVPVQLHDWDVWLTRKNTGQHYACDTTADLLDLKSEQLLISSSIEYLLDICRLMLTNSGNPTMSLLALYE